MPKFIHIADTHLGCKIPTEYGDVREEDFINSFKQIVDFAISNKVDFVIHAGDFFDERFRISIDTLYKITQELVKLKKAGIPFIAIRGNHDLKASRHTAFEQLKISGLLLEPEIGKSIEIGDAVIHGFSEPRGFSGNELKTIYINYLKRLKPVEGKFNILLTHSIPKVFDINLPNEPRYINTSFYPEGFDYYASGHIHLKQEPVEIGNKIYVLPGSTERTEISKREEKVEKGFYFYNDGKIQFVKLNVRNIKVIEYPVFDREELKALIERIVSLGKETIQKIRVVGSEELYKEIISELLTLKRLGYIILLDEIISREKKIEEIPEVEKAESFEDLLISIIKSEAEKVGKTGLVEEIQKFVSVYDELGKERLRQYILNKIKRPYGGSIGNIQRKIGRQKSLLDLY